MKYFQIDRTAEPKIIGITNGAAQVEILLDKIVLDQNFKDFDEHFSGYNLNFWKSQNKVFELKPPVFYGKMRKNANQTDFMLYGQQFRFLTRLYSERLLKIIDVFNVGQYKSFPFQIEKVSELYFLIFFKTVDLDEINYKNSSIHTGYKVLNNVRFHSISNSDEYLTFKEKEPICSFERMSIPKKYSDQDIIHVRGALPFYSEKIIDFLLDCNITGLQIAYNNSTNLEFY